MQKIGVDIDTDFAAWEAPSPRDLLGEEADERHRARAFSARKIGVDIDTDFRAWLGSRRGEPGVSWVRMDPEAELVGEIIAGPELSDYGDVVFRVRVGTEIVDVGSSAMGQGCALGRLPLDVINAANHAVSKWTGPRRDEIQALLRQAGRLRQAKGIPAGIDRDAQADIELLGPPEQRRTGIVFRFRAPKTDLLVYLFANGGIIEDCDEWNLPIPIDEVQFDIVSDEERNAAMAAALNYALAHPEEMTAFGLDMDAYQDLWGGDGRWSTHDAAQR